jgi:hypothetical protein
MKSFWGGLGGKYSAAGIISTVRVRIDADLTDNVSATVRLLNETTWGNNDWDSVAVNANDEGGNRDVAIDLAYVTLKEFFYSPITLTVGRQLLRFGNAMIIGDPDTNLWSESYYVPFDLSAIKSFDAVRATFDYDPLVVDAIYSKIREVDDQWWKVVGAQTAIAREHNDMDLFGVNAKYNAAGIGLKGTIEGYYFSRVDRSQQGNQIIPGGGTQAWAAVSQRGKLDSVHNLGFLVSAEFMKNLTGSLEGTWQFGNTVNDFYNRVNASRSAYAAQATVNYNLKDTKMVGKYSPNVGLIYATFSGDKKPSTVNTAWDPMFEDQTLNTVVNALFANSNCQYVGLKVNFKPIHDLTISGVYAYYWLNAITRNTSTGVLGVTIPWTWYTNPYNILEFTGSRQLGQAWDITATYDYTEDVQFALHYSIYKPGSALYAGVPDGGLWGDEPVFRDNASEIIGSMRVTF